MAKKKSAPEGFDPSAMLELFDPSKLMAQFNENMQRFGATLPGVDLSEVAARQQKNLEALVAANRAIMEGAQHIAQRQSEMLQQAAAEATAAGRQLAGSNPSELTEKQTELMAKAYSRAVEHIEEVSATVQQAQRQALETLNKRWQESLREILASAKAD